MKKKFGLITSLLLPGALFSYVASYYTIKMIKPGFLVNNDQ